MAAPLIAALALAIGAAGAALASMTPATLSAPASNVLEAVRAQYAPITNLSCTVRRETQDDQGAAIETTSLVEWARGDRMRVQVLKGNGGGRRVVIDGESVFVKYPGEEAPQKFLVANQAPTQFANLRSVPASPEEQLAPLADLPATEAKPIAPYARTIAFGDTALLSFDDQGRVACLDFSLPPSKGIPATSSSTLFKAPFEALPGIWLFRRVENDATVDGKHINFVSRFDRIEVNGDIPDTVFDPNFNF